MKRKCVDTIALLISRDHICCDPIRRLSINFIAIRPLGHEGNLLFIGDICLFVILLMDKGIHLGATITHTNNTEQHFEGQLKRHGKILMAVL